MICFRVKHLKNNTNPTHLTSESDQQAQHNSPQDEACMPYHCVPYYGNAQEHENDAVAKNTERWNVTFYY